MTPVLLSPEEDVDPGEALPFLTALWALSLVWGLPPLSQAVPAEAVAAGQRSRVHQHVIATVARELFFSDATADIVPLRWY